MRHFAASGAKARRTVRARRRPICSMTLCKVRAREEWFAPEQGRYAVQDPRAQKITATDDLNVHFANESDPPESGPRLERVGCATTGPSREKLRTRQFDATHDIRLERFSGRCRR